MKICIVIVFRLAFSLTNIIIEATNTSRSHERTDTGVQHKCVWAGIVVWNALHHRVSCAVQYVYVCWCAHETWFWLNVSIRSYRGTAHTLFLAQVTQGIPILLISIGFIRGSTAGEVFVKMSRDSVSNDDYESFVADSDKFFDENFDHETDTQSAEEDIVRILQSMNIVSEAEREELKSNLMNSISDNANTESLGESAYEFYGYLFLNALMFLSFGKPISLVLSLITHYRAFETWQTPKLITEKWKLNRLCARSVCLQWTSRCTSLFHMCLSVATPIQLAICICSRSTVSVSAQSVCNMLSQQPEIRLFIF